MVIAIILFFGVVIISAILAFLSMKNYQEIPAPNLSYTLFLVRNPVALDFNFFQKLHTVAEPLEAVISLERLFKGQDSALVLYGPQNLMPHFPELNLLELEDYLAAKDEIITSEIKKISVNNATCLTFAPINTAQIVKIPNFFSSLSLQENQQFLWQVVMLPIRNTPDSFQITIRAIIVDTDPNQRINLVKRVQDVIEQTTNLKVSPNSKPTGVVYEAFQKRTLIPKEVSSFVLNPTQIISLLGGVS